MRADARKYTPGFGGFLRDWRIARGMSQAALSKRFMEAGLDISDASISDMERRDLAPPEIKLKLMIDALDEDASPWLRAAGYETDEVAEQAAGYKPSSPQESSPLSAIDIEPGPLAEVPVVGDVTDYGEIRWTAGSAETWGEGVVKGFRVVTETLRPDFAPGDVLLPAGCAKALRGTLVIIKRGDGSYFLVRYHGRKAGRLLIAPPHAGENPITTAVEGEIIGRLKGERYVM